MAKFGIAEISVLALDRFRLHEQIEERIQQHRDGEQKAAFQQFLLDGSALTVSEEHAINFKTMSYEPSWLYEGSFKFKTIISARSRANCWKQPPAANSKRNLSARDFSTDCRR